MLRNITIKAVLNGYVVNVGCQTVVFNDRTALMVELGNYLEKPDEVEKRYRTTAINKGILNELPQPEAAMAAPGYILTNQTTACSP